MVGEMDKTDFIEYFKAISKPTRHLMSLTPEERFDWSPGDKLMPLGRLIAHLAYSPGVVVYLLIGENLPKHYMAFEQIPLDDALKEYDRSVDEAVASMEALPEENFGSEEIKAFWGAVERRSKLLMLVFDHLTHHKMQLFIYLKIIGMELNTNDLYLSESGEMSS